MDAKAEFNVGDIVRMKKPHPCGSSNWEITPSRDDTPDQVCEGGAGSAAERGKVNTE